MKYIQKYYYVLTGILAFIFYLTTIAPSVIQIDTGELATVQATLGIAHPTGYPLFTILGYIFSLLPLPFSKIFQLNLLAAIYCAIAVSIFTYTSKLILDNLSSFQYNKTVKVKSKKKKGLDKTQTQTIKVVFELSETIKITAAVFSGLFLALSRTFWMQSTSVEVYSLHILLISLVILFLIKIFVKENSSQKLSKNWILFFVFLALGFSNHMTTILILLGVIYIFEMHLVFLLLLIIAAPMLFGIIGLLLAMITAIIYIYLLKQKLGKHPIIIFLMIIAEYLIFGIIGIFLALLTATVYDHFVKYKFSKESFGRLLILALIFLGTIIIFYSYLPIRASQNPILNWGNPIDLESILRHISGKQYQVWLFSSTEAAAKQFNYFVGNLPKEFSLTLVLVFLGLIVSFLKARKFFIFNIIIFLSTVLYSINYDINDIDSYFLLAYISLSFFAVFGILQIILFAFKNKMKIVIPNLILIIFLGIQFYSSYEIVNQRNNYVYQDYTKALLNSVPKNSIVFSYQWDYFISASYYFQLVENYRKDITVIDKELLRRSWYYNQLSVNHPKLLNGVKSEVNQFIEALKPFEREEQFNSNLLESLYKRIMTGLVSTNIPKHEYYIAPEIVDGEMRRGEFQLPKGYSLIPHLFLFKVVNTTDYIEAPLPNYDIRFENRDDKYIVALKGFLSSMLIRRAMYELQFNKIERAKIYTNKLIAYFPNVTLPTALTNLMNN